jgi:tetratricopeptide (TPR) repeat protein
MSEFRVHEAAVCLEHWIALRPRSIPPRVWRTEIYGVLESTEKLQAELREILRIDPRRLSQRISLATSLLDVSRVEEALAEYEIARRQAPRDPRVLLGLGLCHRRLGTVAQARGELASALAGVLDDAQRSSALMALGDLALQTRDVEQAAGYFEDAMRLTPHEPAAAYALGTTLSKLGRAEMARQHLERSRILDRQMDRLHDIYSQLIRNTNDAKLRAEAATILRAQNRTQEAAKWMISALRYEPTLREAHQLLADYFEDQGEVQLAQRHRAAARDGTQVAESALVDAGRPEP